MTNIRYTELITIEVQFPHLRQLCERYRFLNEALEQAVEEASVEMRLRSMRNKFEDDPELQFLYTNVEIVEEELETTARQLRAILEVQYESRQVRPPASVSPEQQ
jgi:hypothetical protein